MARLLEGPFDDVGGTQVPTQQRKQTDAVPELQALFERYRQGLADVYPIVLSWWLGGIDGMAPGFEFYRPGEPATMENLTALNYERWPWGPAQDLIWIWFIRMFWLECDAINLTLPFDDRVAPQQVLLGWLVEQNESAYVTLVTAMPYWPVGIDANDAWC